MNKTKTKTKEKCNKLEEVENMRKQKSDVSMRQIK